MPPFTTLAGTTWGFPILSALHVLGLAWFGGAVLAPGEFPRLQRAAFLFMLLTGAMLFLMQPAHYTHSIAFWIKLALLGLVLLRARGAWSRPAKLLLWFGVLLAARLTAFL
jgi:hypothetical protein